MPLAPDAEPADAEAAAAVEAVVCEMAPAAPLVPVLLFRFAAAVELEGAAVPAVWRDGPLMLAEAAEAARPLMGNAAERPGAAVAETAAPDVME